MSYYAIVMGGRVLGLREGAEENSLDKAERTALAMYSGEQIDIYEIEGEFPRDLSSAMRRISAVISSDAAEPVSVIREGEAEAEEREEGEDREGEDREATGTYVREPGESGLFRAERTCG